MKYVLSILAVIFFTGCSPFSRECTTTFRDYKYMDRVQVTSGFYKGQRGFIMAQSWMYRVDSCNDHGFQIKIEGTLNDVVTVNQESLEVWR